MAQSESQTPWHVKPDEYPNMDPVVEVWESMSGDLWFITKPDGDRGFGYARLYNMPQFAEWGTINRRELVENAKVWQVERQNWGNISTYEEGLLVKGESE